MDVLGACAARLRNSMRSTRSVSLRKPPWDDAKWGVSTVHREVIAPGVRVVMIRTSVEGDKPESWVNVTLLRRLVFSVSYDPSVVMAWSARVALYAQPGSGRYIGISFEWPQP